MLAGLLDALEVRRKQLKNRIVMPPMQTSLATTEGAVTEALIEHYTRRARAVGLQITEHSYVSLEGRVGERQMGVHQDSLLPGLENLVRRVHATGTPIVIQIDHAGARATGRTSVAPSARGEARELKRTEIEAIVEAFTDAAERAMRAGFDGVEVHGAHGFLLNQFYSPLTNRRRDEYGGSLEKRMRLPLEVVKRVKKRVEGLLLYRLGVEDLDPAGTQIEDSQNFARKLEKAGVDIIDVSGGLCGSRPPQLDGGQGYFIPQARQIKEVVDIPVIGVGGITKPEYANEVIQKGQVDLVAVGRELLKDPDWAIKAVETLTRR